MRLGPLLLTGCLWQIAALAAAQVETLASDLTEPTALAYAPGPTGGFRLLVAERGGGLVEFTMLGEGVLSRRAIDSRAEEGAAEPVIALGWYDKQVLSLTPAGGTLIAADGEGRPLMLSESASNALPLVGPLTLSAKWLVVPSEGGLLRGRLATGRVMGLRRMGPSVLAAAFTPNGYLATLDTDPPAGTSLSYRDPEQPETVIASYGVDGLSEPRALVVRPTDSTLYALHTGEQGAAIARLDVSDTGERPGPIRVAAKPIAAPDDVTALVFGPSGELYLTTKSGKLVRTCNEP